MPTRSKVQALLPSFWGKMFEAIGTFWPIFQPYWFARLRPAMNPVRVSSNACHWASGMTNSGYTSCRRAGSTAWMMSCVFSCQTPPNHWLHITRSTPGTDSICGRSRIGSDGGNATRACVTGRVAPTKSAPAENSTFTACSRPNSRNAVTIDSSVRTVRDFFRHRLAMTNPVRVMAASGGGRLFEQLALLEVQRAARELRGFRVVRHHHDGLAVLAVEHLQKPQDLVRRLAVEVAGRLVADQDGRVRDQRARDCDALFLAAGELPGLVARAIGEAHDLEHDRDRP